ncbi:hypothetical protein [Vreelandella olivaria]|uniref:hypothetical protein n=1 Tax=Vreelandella olivaria TaxID=390919 RepID=UPI00201F637A|nr:hypothetical protein [Halomonas olivaria]
MLKYRPVTIALSVILAGQAANANAQESPWRFQLTPYIWMAGLSGDMRPLENAPTISTSRSFSEVLDDLDGAFFMAGSARRDRLVLFGDITWASLSHEGALPPGIAAEGKLRQRSVTAAAGYQVVSTPSQHLDLLAGARAWRLEAEVNVSALGVSASETERWVDPILAARLRSTWTPRWSTLVHADIGGFGIGSDNTWQAVATANYQISDTLHLSAGYRHLAVDRDESGTRIDVTMSGPLLGATWRF